MAWSYSGDPATSPKDLVRFMCGDTEENVPYLSDEEINYLLISNSPQKAAGVACERIMAKLSKEVDYSIGPERVQASQRLANYRILADTLKKELVESKAYPSWDPGCKQAGFRVGMHDYSGRCHG